MTDKVLHLLKNLPPNVKVFLIVGTELDKNTIQVRPANSKAGDY